MLRREMLLNTGLFLTTPLVSRAFASTADMNANDADLDRAIEGIMREDYVPGLTACLVDKSGILWTKSYGWSDAEGRVPMGPDRIQNIGSISKTFVATAVMQLLELGVLDLDRDISDYLGFQIRNPGFPEIPITARQLMIHTSSLRDGSAYVGNYACGDPRLSLRAWIIGFFTPQGVFFNAEENFNPWAASTKWQYCNLAFGVLGLIVEEVSGIPFNDYCLRNIFAPLGMRSTSWMISDLDIGRFTKPYSRIENGVVRGASWGGVKLGMVTPDGPTGDRPLSDGLHANCFYNHPNYPDGFLRTTVSDLSRYLRAYLNDGLFEDARVLKAATVEQMFQPQPLPAEEIGKRTFGLTWYALRKYDGRLMWGHGGGDPGISTAMYCLRDLGVGVLVFTNTSMSKSPDSLIDSLVARALALKS